MLDMFMLDGATTAALIGALVGGVVGVGGTLAAEALRSRSARRSELREAISAFLTALTDHAIAKLAQDDDGWVISKLELRANTLARVVAMHLSRSEDEVAEIVLGAVVNVSAAEKQFDRADAVGATLMAWFRGEVRTARVSRDFQRRIDESPTARM